MHISGGRKFSYMKSEIEKTSGGPCRNSQSRCLGGPYSLARSGAEPPVPRHRMQYLGAQVDFSSDYEFFSAEL